MLTNLHLERTNFAVALLGFNLGVEGGQLTGDCRRRAPGGRWGGRLWYRSRVVVPVSLGHCRRRHLWTVTRRVIGS